MSPHRDCQPRPAPTDRAAQGQRPERRLRGESQLLRAARSGDVAARRRLVTAYLGLTRSIASRYRGLGLPVEDLAQEGAIGLLEAINDFDPRRSESFEAYARFRIRRAIRNALTAQSRLVRLPKGVVAQRRALAQAETRLSAAGARKPSVEDLAAESGLSVVAVCAALEAEVGVVPLDDGAESAVLAGRVGNGFSPDPEAESIAHEEAARIDQAVSALPSRSREILARHFGLGRPPQPLTEVAPALQLSEPRARAIERDALYALREHLNGAVEPRDHTAA